MDLLGQNRSDLPFPVCSQFQPTLLEGQLCYSINMSKIATGKSKSGSSSYGLLMMVDPSRSLIEYELDTGAEGKVGRNLLDLTPRGASEHSPRIVVNTLESISDFRAGRYGLSALKKMTGTESFLDLPDETKMCDIEPLEKCRARKYIEEVQAQCDCVPWALSSALTLDLEVNPTLDKRISVLLLCPSVSLRPPPLDSETGWAGDLWSNTNLLRCQNLKKKMLFLYLLQVFSSSHK